MGLKEELDGLEELGGPEVWAGLEGDGIRSEDRETAQ
jgi:hypothetical protein